jgi:glycerophosphoryl diester phosphodiesterase
MSFDHWSLKALKAAGCERPLGVLSYRWDDDWMPQLSWWRKWQLRNLSMTGSLGAAFIAYDIDDLPAGPPLRVKRRKGIPLLTWTVRTEEQRARARKYADAIIFEGFEP